MARFRRRRAGGLPAELVRQLHDAERLCDELAESGLALRFERPGAGASGDRVRAVLVDSEGRALRDVRLADVVSLRLG
ncbi:MAG TPA: hypothetical protein VHB30_12060 [Solirubrobacteraceae bacterium]|nr:hypothetical protein [Solirubrobacteraceae bacterium]